MNAFRPFSGLLIMSCCLAGRLPAEQPNKPNIAIILADDLGVECLSSYGGTSLKTPNIDKLAKEGMRFTRCFANPYCSPSRGSLLTGRYPFKNGLTTVLDTKEKEDIYLHPDQPSFARQLKQAAQAGGLCDGAGREMAHVLRTFAQHDQRIRLRPLSDVANLR
jgi:arylsulfatase A